MAKKQGVKGKSKRVAAEPKDKKKPGMEIGQSGTNIFSGMITEEYVPELSGARAMKVYDEMRKSDATVKAVLLAVQLPIRRAKWFVEPASQDEKDIEIAEFVSQALFEYQTITWDDFLRQALLSTAYGNMVFEKVFEIRDVAGQAMITWKKFAPRLPRSISAWELKNGDAGIQQTGKDGKPIEIPMDKLLVFVNEKEGENWWGISQLRAAYKHWYIKSNLEKIDAIAHERQGLGVPFVKLTENATPAERRRAETLLANMRAHEQGFLVEPADMTVDFKDMHTSGTKDAGRSMDYHDRKITMAVLAQFLSLGSGASGSYALSKDHSELFLQSLEAVANGIKDVIDKYAIKQLVDLNFDGVEYYPTLENSGIARKDVEGLSVAYQRLTQSGAIKATEADNDYFRNLMGLPDMPDDEEEVVVAKKEEIQDIEDDLGLPKDSKKKDNREIASAISIKVAGIASNAEKLNFLERNIARVKKFSDKNAGMMKVERALYAKLEEVKTKVFKEENDFKSWRKLTFAEKKVSFQGLQDFIDENEQAFKTEAGDVLKKSTEDYIARLTAAINKGDDKAIREMEMKYFNEYKAVVKSFLKKSFNFGKSNASREMGVKDPANPTDLNKTLDIVAENIATQHHYKIETEARQAATNQLVKFGEKEVKAIAAAASIIASTSGTLLQDTAAIIVAQSINSGRALIFDQNKDKIHALQRSEILDNVTCNFCLSMDGRIVEPGDSIAKEGIFHSNCRGIWVEILKDEEELPNITGVPTSIRDRLGDSVNEVVQPKNPIVKKDSLAAQAIAKKEKQEKKNSEVADHPDQFGECGGKTHLR